MDHLLDYVRSAEELWLFWLGGVLVLGVLTWKALADFDRAGWRSLLAEEDGAAYTLSFVLTFPFYTMFVLLVIETTLFLIVKIGTVQAAYAAARSHIVWSTRGLEARQKAKREQAAINVMAAFASSRVQHTAAVSATHPPPAQAQTNASLFSAAYKAYDPSAPHPGVSGYITRKYIYAHIATRVAVKESSTAWDADVKVTVQYEMPFQLSFIGRILGRRVLPQVRVYTYAVRSSVTLPNDAPRNATRSLGIDYVPRD
jgi:hypothetical protein